MSYVATSRVDVEVNRQPGDKTRRQNGDQQMLVAKMVTMVNDPPDEQHEQYHCDDVDKKDDVKLMSAQGL